MSLRKAVKDVLEALDTYAKQYPHMEKGYLVDAREALRQAYADDKEWVKYLEQWVGDAATNVLRERYKTFKLSIEVNT